MRNTKTDRRSQRTRQLIHRALIELMLERDYDEITVQEIIDRANVGRSTFYAHYLDKEDLLVSGFTNVLDALRQHVEQHMQSDWRSPSGLAFFFEHVQAQHRLYKALVRGGGIDLLYKKGHQRLRQNIEQHLAALVPAGQVPAVPLPLVADHMAGAILNLLRWWLDNGMPYSPDQMETMFHRLVLPGVQAALGVAAGE